MKNLVGALREASLHNCIRYNLDENAISVVATMYQSLPQSGTWLIKKSNS